MFIPRPVLLLLDLRDRVSTGLDALHARARAIADGAPLAVPEPGSLRARMFERVKALPHDEVESFSCGACGCMVRFYEPRSRAVRALHGGYVTHCSGCLRFQLAMALEGLAGVRALRTAQPSPQASPFWHGGREKIQA